MFPVTLVGKKLALALTGLVLVLFLAGHMAGNLKVFLGVTPEGVADIDVYAEFLREVGEPALPPGAVLWAARVVLLAALVAHVVLAVQLVRANRQARPVPYARYQHRASTVAARSMMATGLVLLAFVVFHILHLTTGTIRLGPFVEGEVYANLYHSFRQPLAAVGYVAVMIAVSLHVLHGGWSLFQTWGLDHPDRNRGLRWLARIVAAALLIGFSLVPLAILAGWLPPPAEGAAGLPH